MSISHRPSADDLLDRSSAGGVPARHRVGVPVQGVAHLAEREKIWMACEEHRQRLADYLDVRGFLRRVNSLPLRS
jgi:hypothetical protein